jgi:hypothetical protein
VETVYGRIQERRKEIIWTIPASSSSAERSFSALKRIKTYLRNTQGQERSLAILCIEHVFKKTTEIHHSPNFNNDGIDILVFSL